MPIIPGRYYDGDKEVEVKICEDCGLPYLTTIQEYYFGSSPKGKAKRDEWRATRQKLPYDLDLCECAQHSEEE